MLRIYSVILEMVAKLRPLISQIERKDTDLARQLRRAASSVALNCAEGSYSRGGNRMARYYNAVGSAREVLAVLEVSVALGYLATPDPRLVARLHHIIGTLVRVARPG